MSFSIGKIRSTIFKLLPWRLSGVAYRLVTSTMTYPRKFRTHQVGTNSYVDPSVQVVGWRNVSIGRNSTISEDSWLNVNFRDDSTGRIIIGNNCHVGRRNFFSSGPIIKIKDYVFTGLDCSFLGCGHSIESPLVPYVASGLSEGAGIEVGVNCWLATAVTVLQNVKIGCGSVVGARSLVLDSLPPFSIAIGSPCRVIKRFDFKNNKWIRISEWEDGLDKFMPSEDEYLRLLIESHKDIPISLLSASSRFGWL